MHEKITFSRAFLVILIATLMAALVLIWYGFYYQEPKAPKVQVIMINKADDPENDFWSNICEGGRIAASVYGMEITTMGPPDETQYELQNTMIENAISQAPTAIVLAPCKFDATLPYAKKIEAAGIKLILVDSFMKENVGTSLVATDNVEAGRKMGDYMKSQIGSTDRIGIIGHVEGASTATQREEGIRMGLGRAQEQIVDIRFCDSSFSNAYDLTKKMLTEHPEIRAIFGLNEQASVGAARAVRDMGLKGDVIMVGFDSSKEEVRMLEEGLFSAIVVQRPINMGYLAVQEAYQVSLNEVVPVDTDSGSVLITKDTIYSEKNQKLLFPFEK